MPGKKDEISEEQTDIETQDAEPETTLDKQDETKEEVVSLSAKEHADLVRQAKAAAELGRTVKSLSESQRLLKSSLDGSVKRYSDLETNFNTFKQRDRESELEKYKDDKGMLDVIRIRHQVEDERERLLKARSEFDNEKTQYQTEVEEARRNKAANRAAELAKESGMSADVLLEIATDTAENGNTTYNLKRMERIAKSMPKAKSEEEEEEEAGNTRVKGQRSLATMSGSRASTRGLNTIEDYYAAYNRGDVTEEEMEKARERFGVAY